MALTAPAALLASDGPAWLAAIPPAALTALIFALRTFNLTLATLRLLSVVRGRRIAAWLLGFVQSFLFLSTLAGVMSNISSVPAVLAYAGGYATGLILGIEVEARLAPGYSLLRMISSARGQPLMEAVHQAGFGGTELAAQGLNGMVSMILCYTPRKQAGAIVDLAASIDPDVFITSEHVRKHEGGWPR